MAGKISDLDAAVSVADVDQVELLQGGTNKRATAALIRAGLLPLAGGTLTGPLGFGTTPSATAPITIIAQAGDTESVHLIGVGGIANPRVKCTDAVGGVGFFEYGGGQFQFGDSGSVPTVIVDCGFPGALIQTYFNTEAAIHFQSWDGAAYVDALSMAGGKAAATVQHIHGTHSKDLTDDDVIAFVRIGAIPTDTVIAGRIEYTVTAADASHVVQGQTGTLEFLAVNENGTVTVAALTDNVGPADDAGGTFANAFTSNVVGTSFDLRVQSNTSLTTTSHSIEFRVVINSGLGAGTPL